MIFSAKKARKPFKIADLQAFKMVPGRRFELPTKGL